MIKAIITDVDGVMIGKREGYNYPLPTPEVMQAFKILQGKKIPLVLCTGKASYTIENLIRAAQLDGPHIGDNGTLIFNLIQNKTIKKHLLGKNTVKELVKVFAEENLHFAVNTVTDTFVDENSNEEVNTKRAVVLEKKLIEVPSLLQEIDNLEIIKALATLKNPDEIQRAKKLLEPYKDRVNLFWNFHPITGDWEYAVITAKGINKLSAAREVSESLGILLSDVLGIGDTIGDWDFIKDCGYAGIVGQKHPEVLELARGKGDGKYFLAPSVDENGFVKILEYFKLI